jgi:hypothetical protein
MAAWPIPANWGSNPLGGIDTPPNQARFSDDLPVFALE